MIPRGRVSGTRGGLVETDICGLAVGDGVRLRGLAFDTSGTVLAVHHRRALVAPHGDTCGIAAGANAALDGRANALPLGTCALGRAIDAAGNPLDGGPPIRGPQIAITRHAPLPDERAAVERPFWTGVKTIDALLTIGCGARAGFFGAPGVGKSTLLQTIVEGAQADAVVIGLVGERGREAQQWIARVDRRSSVICATSDRSAAERIRAAEVAIAQAETLARRGLDVLVVLDSLARYAAALREIAIAAGESAGRAGYPPSVVASLASLVERCGVTSRGSITLLATVLNDGDDRDPVSEAARSLLDAHIQLSPRLAQAGRFPAIDVLQSASRTMDAVVDREHARAAGRIRDAVARLERAADARSLGIALHDPETLAAIQAEAALEELLRQDARPAAPSHALRMAAALADTLGEPHGYSD